jgi:glycosyltransferase involved in cell wall biosynthesis
MDTLTAQFTRTPVSVVAQPPLVLVPVYNAAHYLPELIPRIRQFVANDNLLFVNDGSTDDSLEILKREHAHILSFDINQGKGAALKAGFEYAIAHDYRSVLTIDSDLQHLPEELPRFLARDNGESLILGTRQIDREIMPFDRWLTNNLTSLIISVFSRQRVRDSQSGYRLIPVSFIKVLPLHTISYDLESEMLFKAGAAGCAISEVPISTIYEGSHSFINPFSETLRFVRQIWRRIWV